MSLDSMLSLAGMLFAVLGALAALVSYVFDLELADVLVPFFLRSAGLSDGAACLLSGN